MKCKYCNSENLNFTWQEFSNGSTHIRVDCADCGKFVKYAPKTLENLAKVGTFKKTEPEMECIEYQGVASTSDDPDCPF